ncbi:MAG: DUF4089 domain-containing protein [Moorea sp. SIOASIH]|uniref:DUF4089 domain-containing protein n=2 Tax=unclassified Moorena TaxID=2683338 RepID=UPI0013BC468D|nr:MULTISPECIES: DUF4089 domain-containing protein [unclassified Moorena]NEO37840.1 DUF4089 domain-containing protein [Moorena sp. SIOASIH]NEO80865.1 DUF4089 domain-containing protein [Moorena sp. SIO4G3]
MMPKKLETATYVEAMAQLLDLDLKPQHRPGVIKNFATIYAIASLVTEFSLPDDIAAAPVFEP